VFVSSTGDVYPAGFLPIVLGNVKDRGIVELYREHPLLRQIRAAAFQGKCGRCDYRELCGGSRSRAYASTGDPLAEDPACAYVAAA
jgi:radical SAM protein with 4Fe4S-binding SPASM domain